MIVCVCVSESLCVYMLFFFCLCVCVVLSVLTCSKRDQRHKKVSKDLPTCQSLDIMVMLCLFESYEISLDLSYAGHLYFLFLFGVEYRLGLIVCDIFEMV